MVEQPPVNVTVESPNIQVDAPVSVGFFDGVQERLRELVEQVKQGDDEVMTALFLGTIFVVAGVFVWRRL